MGCVLVDVHGRVLAIGHNGSPKGQLHCIDVPCPGAGAPSGTHLDLCEAVHAEANALLFCSDIMKIHAVYCTTAPCLDCVKLLLQTSAQRIVFETPYNHGHLPMHRWLGAGTIVETYKHLDQEGHFIKKSWISGNPKTWEHHQGG